MQRMLDKAGEEEIGTGQESDNERWKKPQQPLRGRIARVYGGCPRRVKLGCDLINLGSMGIIGNNE